MSGTANRQGLNTRPTNRQARAARFCPSAVLFALLALPAWTLAEPVLEVYDTYWPAEKLLPVVKAELGPQDTLQVFRNKLVIRAERDTHARIADVLEAVDRAPRNVLISLRQGSGQSSHLTNQGSQVTWSSDQAPQRIDSQGNSSGTVRIYQGSSTSTEIHSRTVAETTISTRNDTAVQQVRVLEGEEARISLGEETPRTEASHGINGVATTTVYKATGRYLFVTPQVTRKGIRLSVSSRSSRKTESGTDQIDTEGLETVVLAEEGFWTPIGGSGLDTSSNDGSITWSTRGLKERSTQYEIKADLLP